MPMRTHELHPSLVHAPLALLPLAAAIDVAALVTRSTTLDRIGRSCWWLGCASGVAAGLAGLAASQEVTAPEAEVEDMIYLHGAGNAAILAASSAVALFRSRRRPTLVSTAVGVSSTTLALFTAYLGGEMVYRHGVGVGETRAPALLSAQAPQALVRDGLRGARWLLRRTAALLRGGDRVRPEALHAEPAVRMARAAGWNGQGPAHRA